MALGRAMRPPRPNTSSSLSTYRFPAAAAGAFISTRTQRACAGAGSFSSSPGPPAAGSACRSRQDWPSSEACNTPAAGRWIQCSATLSKVQSAPRSTDTHSSPVPAAIHALEKRKGPPTSTALPPFSNETCSSVHFAPPVACSVTR